MIKFLSSLAQDFIEEYRRRGTGQPVDGHS